VVKTMSRVNGHVASLTDRALAGTDGIPGLRTYGPPTGAARSPLLAFTVRGTDPRALATALDREGVEARAGCHCASLAHWDLGLDPGTCRLSFAAYTNEQDVDRAVDALAAIVRRG
jgi:cysteine desulfurase/selenocysteine lyase